MCLLLTWDTRLPSWGVHGGGFGKAGWVPVEPRLVLCWAFIPSWGRGAGSLFSLGTSYFETHFQACAW